MKTLLCMILAMYCAAVAANSNFVSNPYAPYPPACARVPAQKLPGWAQEAKFFDQEIELFNGPTGRPVVVRLEAHRSPCAEPDRSLIWLTFSLLESPAGNPLQLELPYAVSETASRIRRGMNLVTDPNGWGAGGRVDRERIYLVSEHHGIQGGYASPDVDRKWVFLLDNGPIEAGSAGGTGLTATEYNAAFRLILRYPPYDFLTIDVPATAEVFPAPTVRLPLSGRHSGTWVIAGAADQGFQLAISQAVRTDPDTDPDDGSLPFVIFFSQYTFDAESRPVWLVGDAKFVPGVTRVTIPVFRVTDGQFRGSRRADRERIGEVTLTSRSCNDVAFAYDYSAIGLGAGSRRLKRLFSLETAGYACRDYEARVAANR